MGMIFTTQKCKNPKKKPGWKEREAEEAAWLAKINGMKLFAAPGKKYAGAKVVPGKQVEVVKDGNLPPGAHVGVALQAKYTTMSGTKKVHRPEIVYRDNPELLERELKARERKFNVAPAYNKAGDSYVTEEELLNLLSSNKRRS